MSNFQSDKKITSSSAFIFICGVGRSGTSLVQSMLGSHSEIAFPPETAFIRRYISTQLLNRIYKNGGLDAVINRLSSDNRIKRLRLDIQDSLLLFLKGGKEFTDVGVYNMLLEQYAGSVGKTKVGDKDPRLIEYLPLIRRFWPKAFVIHVIRDPRDVLASKKKAQWSKMKSSFFHIFVNRVQLKMGREMGAKLFGDRYQEIIFEELISNPESVLKEACRKLGLKYDPAMLNFSSTAKQIVSQSEISWKKETLGPLLSQNRGKWKTALTEREIALTEAVCEEAFDIGGYKRSNRTCNLSYYKRACIWASSLMIKILDWIYRRYRLWVLH